MFWPRFGDKHVATAGALVVLGTTMGVLGDVESEKAWAVNRRIAGKPGGMHMGSYWIYR